MGVVITTPLIIIILVKRFKFSNTGECIIDNVIQLIQCRVCYCCHLNVKVLYTVESDHIIVLPSALFGIVYFSQRYVTRAVMRPDLYTFNIIEINNSIKQIQRASFQG